MLDFFPSATLSLYLARMFLVRILAVLAMLVMVLMMLDLLGETGDILSIPGNGQAELLRYVSLRVPQLVARFLPYSVLLATIITLSGLNQNSEVTAMKAAGLSAHQILAPLLLAAAVVAAASFGFNERIVTRATAALKLWQAGDYAPVPAEPDARLNVYLNDGSSVLMAAKIAGSAERTVLSGVTFYERDEDGMIARQIRSARGRFAAPGWRLEQARIFDVATAVESVAPQVVVARGITLAQVGLRRVDPDAESLWQLSRSIAALDASGRPNDEIRAKWWHKISGPLAALLMPLLGAVAGFGLARSGKLLARAVTGMALGFAFFVIDNAALAMAGFGGYPPALAAWAPVVLFALLGETVLIKTEE